VSLTRCSRSAGGTRREAQPERFPIIDALRGLSILLVIVLHVQIRIPLEQGSIFRNARGLWFFFCRNGNGGVRMFFVISGFIITLTSLRRWTELQSIDARTFYRNRFARIAPPLLILLLVLGILHFLRVPQYAIDPAKVSYWRAALAALTFHLNWLEGVHGYLPASWDVLWSLSVEEAFYLFFPLACLLFRWRGVGEALLLSIVLVGPFVRRALQAEPIWQSKAYFACMDSIALGCLTAKLTHAWRISRPVCAALATCGGTVVVAVLAFRQHPFAQPLDYLGVIPTVLSLGVAALLVSSTRSALSERAVRWLRPLTSYGRLSYEIYLTHAFVVLTGVTVYQQSGMGIDAAYAVLAVVLGASWVFGAVVERYISSPGHRLLRPPPVSAARPGQEAIDESSKLAPTSSRTPRI
jgi:peptidoglycan/LPS O-acetylase OafA/YrhL